jgi:hypothetical protein
MTDLPESTTGSPTAGSFNEKTLTPPSPNAVARFPSGATTPNGFASRNMSRRGSFSGSVRSTRSMQSSMMEDIKHEVMTNYLFQQQCSSLWVGDGSGMVEGVVLRKSKGHYMTCPTQLIESPFAAACAAMNVQVWTSRSLFKSMLTSVLGRNDCQFTDYQNLSPVVSGRY